MPARGGAERQWCTVPKVALETPHFALHTSHLHFTLHAPHFISSRLIWALLTSSQLLSFHLSTAQPFSSHRGSSLLISTLLHDRKLLLSERSGCAQKAFARRRTRHRCVYTEKHLHTESFCTWEAFSTQHTFPRKFRSQTSDNMDRWKAE